MGRRFVVVNVVLNLLMYCYVLYMYIICNIKINLMSIKYDNGYEVLEFNIYMY